MRSAFTAVLALFLLAACSDSTESLKQLRHADPSQDAYQSALATRYQEYSEERVAAYDWWVSKYFADKGLMAAYGREVLPEDPKLWNIPATLLPEFTDARNQLIAVLPSTKKTKPAESAQAVVAYDRWVEAQDRKWDAERIEEARDHFFAALNLIDTPAATGSDEDAAQTPAPTPVETTSTILYFPFDSPNLTETAKAAVQELASYLTSAGRAKININGHADRAGTDEYNMGLSQERARLVMEALAAAGVPRDAMEYFAFGETDNEVPTDDGVREPLNRRVEIFIE